MKIAILGTRGIPNTYGGFEQFAEYLSVGLVNRGHSVAVYNVSFHEYKENEYKGVKIRKIYSPEKLIGASANFIYDFLCLKDALRNNFDVIYELGYHSNAPSYYFLKKNSPILITNMDGLEWKRSKWSFLTRKLIRHLERIAVERSDYLVSDNLAIQDYYKQKFGVESFYIPYGADVVTSFDKNILESYQVESTCYFLLIARLEPENNIEMILDGFVTSEHQCPFLVVGDKETKYGRYLQKKYRTDDVHFLGSIYDKPVLDNLRYFSKLYFHGHSVGGTNPSLLEAMASQTLIVAHDNVFNRSVLGEDSFYFKDSDEVSSLIKDSDLDHIYTSRLINNNLEKIKKSYSWEKIISTYESLVNNLLIKSKI